MTAYRRAEDGFRREIHSGLEATIPLSEIETELPLAELYESVELVPEPEEDSG